MSKFRQSHSVEDGRSIVELGGVMDEDSELSRLAEDLDDDQVDVDLAGVERVNGAGLEVWREFVSALIGKGAKVKISRCSPAMIAQLSRTDAGAVEIASVAIPYFCPECDVARTLHADVSDLGDPCEAPVRRCPDCELVMQFDDDDSYFDVLRSSSSAKRPRHVSIDAEARVTDSARPFVLLVVFGLVIIAGAVIALSFSG